jgi:two-component system, chemotaxis family, sensor kinase Cph1
VPDEEFIENLIYWLQARNVSGIHQELHLSDVFDQAVHFQDSASGILVITINQDKGEYIIGFRPEVVQTIKWGGNPNEAINFEADNKTYHPRNSFKLWQETVKQTCKPWDKVELDVSERFRSFIYEFTTK